VKEGLGESVQPLKDVFHVVQDIGKAATTVYLYAEDFGTYPSMFLYFADDMLKLRETMLLTKSVEVVDRLLANPRFIKTRKDVRRTIRNGKDIVKCI
jgi:hypothetical protein